ncbi:hypothetical protein PV325_012365, partial [Microctonus aethiopoides]
RVLSALDGLNLNSDDWGESWKVGVWDSKFGKRGLILVVWLAWVGGEEVGWLGLGLGLGVGLGLELSLGLGLGSLGKDIGDSFSDPLFRVGGYGTGSGNEGRNGLGRLGFGLDEGWKGEGWWDGSWDIGGRGDGD